MMSNSYDAKILIAGGSVAGLALANALEQNGISFLVLEKYERIAPDLGASIGVFPNGARILDQLGCQNAIEGLVKGADAFEYMGMRDDRGRDRTTVINASQHFTKLLGYSPIFVDRQMLIQILYDNLRDKSKVLTGKDVVRIASTSDGVQVSTKDGSSFAGEILVGADGIHSTVRREMWRIADNEREGHFPIHERDNVCTEYCCIFGISNPIEKFIQSSSQMVQGHDHSYLVATGPGSRVYWFLFKKLDKASRGLYGKIPRFSNSEMDALAAEHADDPITPTLTFGEIYQQRTTATLQALPEVVFSQWYYGRMITIGDAAHKFNPIGGQGGNSAIEDVASLTNHLSSYLKSGTPLTPLAVTEIFSAVQSERLCRARELCQTSHMMQKLQAQDSLISRFISKYFMSTEPDSTLNMLCSISQPAMRLKTHKAPNRPHFERFFDERPASVFPERVNKTYRIFFSVVFVIMMYVAHIAMSVPTIKTLLPGSPLEIDATYRLAKTAALGKSMLSTTSVFTDSLDWTDRGHLSQLLHLLCLAVPMILLWYIEGNRNSARASLLSRPIVFSILMNFLSIGKIGPLYWLVFIWSTQNNTNITAIGRHIPASIAKALVPSIFFGFAVPGILMIVLMLFDFPHPGLLVQWKISAILVSSIMYGLSRRATDREEGTSSMEKRSSTGVTSYYLTLFSDIPAVLSAYKVMFVFSALCHISFIAVGLLSTNPHLSLPRMIHPWVNLVDQPRVGANMFEVLKWNFVFAAISMVLCGVYAILGLRSQGVVTTDEAWEAIAIFGGGQIFVGPGAALMGLWLWREKKIATGHVVVV